MSTIDLTQYATIQQTSAHPNTSDRYAFIPTTKPLAVLADFGWFPTKVQESRTLSEEKRGFQNHIVFVENPEFNLGEEKFRIAMLNNHMGTARFQFFQQLYRKVCANGLYAWCDSSSFGVRHVGYADDQVAEALQALLSNASKTIAKVPEFKAIQLDRQEQEIFASSAIEMAFDGEKYSVEPRHVLTPRRYTDNQNDLWTVYNRVQENLIKGGVPQRRSNGTRIRSKQVKSIDRDIKLNQALWTLTEKMAQLKA